MARPAFLQFLKHGKLLCRANFGAFVQTWNYVVRRCDSLRGEVEADGDGYITLDNADPENPVIRFRADKLPKGGGAEYKAGNDTNIVFGSPDNDGKIPIDVYYK